MSADERNDTLTDVADWEIAMFADAPNSNPVVRAMARELFERRQRDAGEARDARLRAIEECARSVDLICEDWRRIGSQMKVYAAEYIAKWLRDLAAMQQEARK